MSTLATAESFADFEAQARAQGFDEVMEKIWAPRQEVPQHQHPFDVNVRVMAGEVWLTCGSEVKHLVAGTGFQLARGEMHTERYGPEGATFWVARRHAAAGGASAA